jgi:hypothetical protein
LTPNIFNPYRYVIQSTCEIADGSDYGFLGHDSVSGLINTLGFNPQTGNSFIGETVTTFYLYLKQTGSPTGNVRAEIFDASNSSLVASDTIIDSDADLTSSFVKIGFTFSSAFTVTDDFTYAIKGSGTNNWNDSNGVDCQFSSGTTITGNQSKYQASGWVDQTKTISVCF